MSKSFLAPYDGSVPYTPNFASLATEGITFEAHRTEAGSSGVAYAALFSGAQVDRHRVASHPAALSDDLYLITEAFRDAGYATAYWNKQPMASAALNYAQGIDAQRVFRRQLDGEDKDLRRLLGRIRNFPNERAFIVVNMTPTHGPYRQRMLSQFLGRFPDQRGPLSRQRLGSLVKTYRANHLRLAYNFPDSLAQLSLAREDVPALAEAIERLYASNVWHLDRLLGGVLDRIDALGLHDESVIAVTADHGEVLYREHEVFPWTHSSSLAPEVIEVPLIIRAPGLEPGRYAGVTRSIDVFPTLLGLAGIPVPDDRGIQGVDLSDVLRGRRAPPDLSAYSHTAALAKRVVRDLRAPDAGETWGQRVKRYPTSDFRHVAAVLRRGDLVVKLLSDDGESFRVVAFDHRTDPYEAVDVFQPDNPAHAEAARDVRSYKSRLQQSLTTDARKEPRQAPPTQETEDALRVLGYIE